MEHYKNDTTNHERGKSISGDRGIAFHFVFDGTAEQKSKSKKQNQRHSNITQDAPTVALTLCYSQ
jgi:hypothetical protein